MPEQKLKILIVDDDPSIRNMLSIVLKKERYSVISTGSGEEALKKLKNGNINMVISDIKMPGMNGIELLGRIKKLQPQIPVLMITAFTSTDDAINAMKMGAEDYVSKPFNLDELKIVIKKTLNKKALEKEVVDLRSMIEKRDEFESIIGKNPQMLEIYDLIETVANTDSTILITGESGTGKELIAKAIHKRSSRTDEKFISVNCGALPENLLESELFGHIKGAFTDAVRDKKGLFLESSKGTLFLDEISEMSQPMQVKLLRAIQERTIRPVGGNNEIEVNSRIISATNKDLKELIDEGNFRFDLFYRLNVISIKVPPLRERMDDFSLLSKHFISKFNRKFNKNVEGIERDALDILIGYSWPGNIRELENYFERAIALESGESLTVDTLPDEIAYSFKSGKSRSDEYKKLILENNFDFNEFVDEMSKEILLYALELNNFSIKKTSEMLKLNYRSVRYLIEKYNLKKKKNH